MLISMRAENSGTARKRSRAADSARRMSVERLEDRVLMSADSVLDWNAVALGAVAADHSVATPAQGGPTRTARALAIVHGAMFDAANAIDHSFTSYLVHRNGPKRASIDAAVAQAAHDTLANLYPQQTATFDAALAATLAGVPDGPNEKKGIAIGRVVAKKTLNARADDGSALDPPYTEGTLPGEHRQDPLHPTQGFLTPGWGSVTPFAMTDGAQFRSEAPPLLSSAEYATAFNDVKVVGADDAETSDRDGNGMPDRTPEQTVTGIFWGYDGSPGLGTPPRLYNQIARVIAVQQGNTEIQNARMFALINIAMADAGIASWETKYVFNFWRPVIGVREADPGTGPSGLGDGNAATTAEAGWSPLGAPCSNDCGAVTNFTPPFPAYTSGHATFGAAMFMTLTNFYGRDNIAFTFTSDEFNGVTTDQNGNVRPVVTRTYSRLSEAAEENGQSRIYLGIHWVFDKTAGIAQGNAIADYVFQNFLRPRAAN